MWIFAVWSGAARRVVDACDLRACLGVWWWWWGVFLLEFDGDGCGFLEWDGERRGGIDGDGWGLMGIDGD